MNSRSCSSSFLMMPKSTTVRLHCMVLVSCRHNPFTVEMMLQYSLYVLASSPFPRSTSPPHWPLIDSVKPGTTSHPSDLSTSIHLVEPCMLHQVPIPKTLTSVDLYNYSQQFTWTPASTVKVLEAIPLCMVRTPRAGIFTRAYICEWACSWQHHVGIATLTSSITCFLGIEVGPFTFVVSTFHIGPECMFNHFFPNSVYIDSNHSRYSVGQATYMHELGDIILMYICTV